MKLDDDLKRLRDFVVSEGDEVHTDLFLRLVQALQGALAGSFDRSANHYSNHWGEYFRLEELPNGSGNPMVRDPFVLQAGDTAHVRATGFRQSEGLYVCVSPGDRFKGDAVWAPLGAANSWATQLAEARAEIAALQEKRMADAKETTRRIQEMYDAMEDIHLAIDFELRDHDGGLADKFGPGAFNRLMDADAEFYRVFMTGTKKPR